MRAGGLLRGGGAETRGGALRAGADCTRGAGVDCTRGAGEDTTRGVLGAVTALGAGADFVTTLGKLASIDTFLPDGGREGGGEGRGGGGAGLEGGGLVRGGGGGGAVTRGGGGGGVVTRGGGGEVDFGAGAGAVDFGCAVGGVVTRGGGVVDFGDVVFGCTGGGVTLRGTSVDFGAVTTPGPFPPLAPDVVPFPCTSVVVGGRKLADFVSPARNVLGGSVLNTGAASSWLRLSAVRWVSLAKVRCVSSCCGVDFTSVTCLLVNWLIGVTTRCVFGDCWAKVSGGAAIRPAVRPAYVVCTLPIQFGLLR